jgi:hypothetical protein
MSLTYIHGSFIEALTIEDAQISATAAIATSKLADGAYFAKINVENSWTSDQNFNNLYTLKNIIDPVADQDAATKHYVDAIAQGLHINAPAKYATLVDLGATFTPVAASGGAKPDTLSGSFKLTVDGVDITSVTNPVTRVLVKSQTLPEENGVYDVTSATGSSFVLTRSHDFDGTPTEEVQGGDFVFVQGGNTMGGTGWVVDWDGIVTIDVNPINWVQFSSAGAYTAGNGINISGQVISVLGETNASANIARVINIVSTGVSVRVDASTIGEKIVSGGNELYVLNGGITATQINSSSLGNGLTGGSGTSISVVASVASLANTARAISVTSDGLSVKIDDTTIGEEAGTYRLYVKNGGITSTQINSSAVGNGLTGGSGTSISVLAETTVIANTARVINVASTGVSVRVDDTTIGEKVVSGGNQLYVKDGGIANLQIANGANIAINKLASGTSGQIIVCNSSGVPTYVAMSGDATIDNTGYVTVTGGSVTEDSRVRDLFTGDNSTTDFVLTYTPVANLAWMDVYLDGALLREGDSADYTVNIPYKTITFLFTPKTGRKITVKYLK